MLLLDSQVLLWVSTDDGRIGLKSRDRIGSALEVFVSSASVFELTMKSMLGKLTLPVGFFESLADLGLVALPISHDDAAGVVAFPELARHDPFDRLLVSQAKRRGYTLLTADRVLLALGFEFIANVRD